MNLKKELLIVFNPYVPKGQKREYRYKCISANRLADYIPQHRADNELQKFMKSGKQKDNFYVKQCGKVYMYRK